MFDFNKCNCGREVRYSHFKDGNKVMPCNKHQVCPTYEELENQLKSLRRKYRELKHAASDVLLYHEDSDLYRCAEKIVRKHEEYLG